ncbi:MAG: redoxin domain-containing protein [Planctomycetota bacterium]
MNRVLDVMTRRFGGALAVGLALAAFSATAWTAQDGDQEKKKEQEKPAAKAEIGKPAPPFELKDVDGKTVKLADSKGKTVVLEWFCPTCPYCVQAYGEKGALKKLPEELEAKGIVWLSIVSEKPENKGGKVETIKKFMEDNGLKAPMLLDPDGKVGKAYGAKTTPHMFVIDGKGILVYQGALDNAPFGKVEGERVAYVEDALADLAAGKKLRNAETKSWG